MKGKHVHSLWAVCLLGSLSGEVGQVAHTIIKKEENRLSSGLGLGCHLVDLII